MVYIEEKRDLFSVDSSYYLAHCISADYALGAGIAVEFNKRFDMRKKLYGKIPNAWQHMQQCGLKGMCIRVDNVLNLVTKEKYWYKPTYDSLRDALESMRDVCKAMHIEKVAMPMIGCGLDKLSWDKVSNILMEIFECEDIVILVCKR